MWKTFAQRMVRRGTWVTALVVGTLINLYGQVLVPMLRGSGGPFAELHRSFVDAPALATLSVALGYLFPLTVTALAAARTQMESRSVASLAQFPDLKPDPVFRAAPSGEVIEAGAQTRTMFERHAIRRAQDLLGEELWSRIATEVPRDGGLASPETVFYAPEQRWYAVAASSAPDGINVYLALVPNVTGAATSREAVT